MEQGTENYCKTKETLMPYSNHADNLKIQSKGEGSVNVLPSRNKLVCSHWAEIMYLRELLSKHKFNPFPPPPRVHGIFSPWKSSLSVGKVKKMPGR